MTQDADAGGRWHFHNFKPCCCHNGKHATAFRGEPVAVISSLQDHNNALEARLAAAEAARREAEGTPDAGGRWRKELVAPPFVNMGYRLVAVDGEHEWSVAMPEHLIDAIIAAETARREAEQERDQWKQRVEDWHDKLTWPQKHLLAALSQAMQAEARAAAAEAKAAKYREGLQVIEVMSGWHDDDLATAQLNAKNYREQGDALPTHESVSDVLKKVRNDPNYIEKRSQ